MKIGVTKFPGTNNEQDIVRVLQSLNVQNQLIGPYDAEKLNQLDAVVIAGGFSYGDYLRPGIIAAKTQMTEGIKKFVEEGKFVLGICNGFQILCEAGILPGVLTTNTSTKFISKWIRIKTEHTSSIFLKEMESMILNIPIAHFEGNYYNPSEGVDLLKSNNQIAFRYCTKEGIVDELSNPNGSIENIAGIISKEGNVLGMMPHPERASFDYLGSEDGRKIFTNLIEELK